MISMPYVIAFALSKMQIDRWDINNVKVYYSYAILQIKQITYLLHCLRLFFAQRTIFSLVTAKTIKKSKLYQ